MSAEPRNRDQILRQYQSMKNESQQLMRQIRELQSQHNEHRLVAVALEKLPEDRRCFRMVGGVLVERTVREVLPAVKLNIEKIEETSTSLMEKLKAKEAEIGDFRIKHDLQLRSDDVPIAQDVSKSTGVLA
eukprot:c44_g1_i1.p1 GENE.c44_g1_i1~~c44_g1_i1.p1  ORF type:complete len:131 (-),score=34.45 c44_g1_i1:58-450(-)